MLRESVCPLPATSPCVLQCMWRKVSVLHPDTLLRLNFWSSRCARFIPYLCCVSYIFYTSFTSFTSIYLLYLLTSLPPLPPYLLYYLVYLLTSLPPYLLYLLTSFTSLPSIPRIPPIPPFPSEAFNWVSADTLWTHHMVEIWTWGCLHCTQLIFVMNRTKIKPNYTEW